MAQQLGRLGEHALWSAHVDIDPLQPFRNSPLKYSPATSAAGLQARFAHQREHACLFAGLDHDERKARGEQHFQLAARI